MFGRLLERRSRSGPVDPVSVLYQARRPGFAPVSADRAMRLWAVWSCHRILSGIGSTLPIDQFRAGRPVGRAELWDEPQAGVPLPTWLRQLWMSLLSAGNAYGLVTVDGRGTPRSAELLAPDEVQWARETSGRWTMRYRGAVERPWPLGRIWHLPLFTVAGRTPGLNPIEYAAATIGAGLDLTTFSADWFAGGGHPSAILSSDNPNLTADGAQAIKDSFVAATEGREPAVLGSGLSYTPVQAPPDAAMFLDAMGATGRQIAAMIGVPGEWIGEAGNSGGNVTYANREQRWTDFIVVDLMAYLLPIEVGLSRLLPRDELIKFNLDAVLRSDLKTRYETYRIAAQIYDLTGYPVLDGAEIRDLENREPIPGAVYTRRQARQMGDPDADAA